MRTSVLFLCLGLAATGCKKGTGGGTGGGGGGWLVGSSGLMSNIHSDATVGAAYDLGSSQELYGIACRYLGEAWVVGSQGTLLYTNDGGTTWSAQAVPTNADLRTLGTQDSGPVFIAGNGTFLMSTNTGATWTELSDGQTAFRSIATAQESTNVLALGDDGRVWQYDGTLKPITTLPGARALAVSPDGELAIAVGTSMYRSVDGGATWTALAAPAVSLDDVRIAEDGSAVAVGAAGTIANIDATGAVTLQTVGTANLHALHIADPEATDATGYAAGDGGQVLITQDSGLTWTMGPNVGRTVFGVDEIGFGHR